MDGVDDVDPRQAQQTGAEHGEDGGQQRDAHAAHRCAGNLVATSESLRGQHHVHAYVGKLVYRRVGGEKVDEKMLLPHEQGVERGAAAEAEKHTYPERAAHALWPSRTVVLTNEADGRTVESGNDEVAVVLEVEGSRRAGYGGGAVAVAVGGTIAGAGAATGAGAGAATGAATGVGAGAAAPVAPTSSTSTS